MTVRVMSEAQQQPLVLQAAKANGVELEPADFFADLDD